ncbi:MAG: hypothetical protein AAB373_03375 [Patescibacteria group bacterium]
MAKTLERKKVNFMISKDILLEFNELIPPGERSNFMNSTLENALIQFSRRKASEEMDKLAAGNLKISTKEFLKTRHDGLL